MIELLKKDGSLTVISDAHIARLQRDYPRLDVDCELRKMRNWLEANPRMRKSNVDRFITNWLNRARPINSDSVSRETSQHYALVTERMRAPPAQPKFAQPEVAQSYLDGIKKSLGMRRDGQGDSREGTGLHVLQASGTSQPVRVRE